MPPRPENRDFGRLQAAVRRERMISTCLVIVALHVAVVAVLFPAGASVPVRAALLLCAVLGPPLLLLGFGSASRVARVCAVGVIGLGATVAGLATSLPHAVLAGAGNSDFTGILGTAAGVVLVGVAFREALRGRRLAVKLVLGALCMLVIAQWLVAPAINVGLTPRVRRSRAP